MKLITLFQKDGKLSRQELAWSGREEADIHSQPEIGHKDKLFGVRISSGGAGWFSTCRGGGQKVWYVPRSPEKTNFLERCPKSFATKSLCSIIGPYVCRHGVKTVLICPDVAQFQTCMNFVDDICVEEATQASLSNWSRTHGYVTHGALNNTRLVNVATTCLPVLA